MKVTDLKQNPIVIEWLQTANTKPNTEKAYICKGCKISQIIQEKTLKPY